MKTAAATCKPMAQTFRDLFVLRGETVTAFAKRSGFARDTVHRWIRGDRRPIDAHLLRLAEALGVTIAQLEAALDVTAESVGKKPKA